MAFLAPLLSLIRTVFSAVRTVFLLFLALLAVRLAHWIYSIRVSRLNAVRGPAGIWSIPGHFKIVLEPDRIEEMRGWLSEYGDSVRIQGPFGVSI